MTPEEQEVDSRVKAVHQENSLEDKEARAEKMTAFFVAELSGDNARSWHPFLGVYKAFVSEGLPYCPEKDDAAIALARASVVHQVELPFYTVHFAGALLCRAQGLVALAENKGSIKETHAYNLMDMVSFGALLALRARRSVGNTIFDARISCMINVLEKMKGLSPSLTLSKLQHEYLSQVETDIKDRTRFSVDKNPKNLIAIQSFLDTTPARPVGRLVSGHAALQK